MRFACVSVEVNRDKTHASSSARVLPRAVILRATSSHFIRRARSVCFACNSAVSSASFARRASVWETVVSSELQH